MAAPQLEVIISANIAALEKSLDTAEKAIENLNRNAGDTDGLDKLNEAFDSLKGQGDAVKTELINTGKASKGLISNFKNSASSAGELVSAFSGLEGAAGEAASEHKQCTYRVCHRRPGRSCRCHSWHHYLPMGEY